MSLKRKMILLVFLGVGIVQHSRAQSLSLAVGLCEFTSYAKGEGYLNKQIAVPYMEPFEDLLLELKYTPTCLAAFNQGCLVIAEKKFGKNGFIVKTYGDWNTFNTDLDDLPLSCLKSDLDVHKKHILNPLPDKDSKPYLKFSPIPTPGLPTFMTLLSFILGHWDQFSLNLSLAILGILGLYFSSSALCAFFTGGSSLSLEPAKALVVAGLLMAILMNHGHEIPGHATRMQASSVEVLHETENLQTLDITLNGKSEILTLDKKKAQKLLKLIQGFFLIKSPI